MPDGGAGTMYGLEEGKYFDTRRRMLDLVNRMHAHGAQLDLDLPQIAVIGNQSAGKSSLIESISGISLPRSSGTCTRCPTECKLSKTRTSWKCTVTLRFITDQYGSPLASIQNIPFGPVMVDRDEVEERLRRAQLAILEGPDADFDQYLELEDVESAVQNQSGFSRNYISLQISGPDVPDLSFVDLPGIIASVSKGADRNDIQLVRSLVSEHISKASCIILLTVSCETDFENQGAFELAREHDPDGQRTIGVLTKPDRIDDGDSAKWTPIFDNSQQPLAHGWFAVKQRSTRELHEGISREVARQNEADFFASATPWSNLVHHKARMGTPKLTVKLSEILTNLIGKRLPKLQEEVTSLVEMTQKALNSLPPAPSENPVAELLNLIRDFSRTIERDVRGTPNPDGLIQLIREDHHMFRKSVRSTAPEFRPYPKNRAGVGEEGESFLNPSFVPEAEHITTHLGKVIYVDEVMNRADKSITRELPDNYSYTVTEDYIVDFIKSWDRPARDLFAKIELRFNQHIKKRILEYFDRHDAGGLNIAVQNAVTQYLNTCKSSTLSRLQWLLEVERQPFTLNDHYLSEYKRKWLNHFRVARRRMEHPDLMRILSGVTNDNQEMADRINEALAKLQLLGLACKADDLASLLKPDSMDYALRIMAEVRAYYHVAHKRYVDNVPLAIDSDYLRAFKGGIENHLLASLGVSTPQAGERAKGYLQEAPDMSQQRQELTTRLERLENARREFLELF